MKSRRGFTLIEILVVIAIIAVLAGFLFPVLTAARRRGHESSDIAQMKQIYLAFAMYEDENDARSPETLKILEPLVRDKRLFRAPLDKVKTPMPDGWPARPFVACAMERSPFRISYGYLKTYPPYDESERMWQEKRNDPQVGLIASPWNGRIVREFRGDFACGEIINTVSGPLFDGPILRINMDGSLFRWPSNRHKDMMGNIDDFFFYR
jgi:prepilin-type N-terminal cleavage/methylation domain-containing protein